RRPAEGEIPVEHILITGRHHVHHAQLAGEWRFAILFEAHREWLRLVAMIDIAHPESIISRARDDDGAPATGFGLLGRGAHRVPGALASLRKLGGDPRPGNAPRFARLALAGHI